MPNSKTFIQPRTLLKRIRSTTVDAQKSGSLHSIPTTSFILPEEGLDFLVRRVESLAEKDKEAKRALDLSGGQAQNTKNPFLPYDEDMYVGHIGDTHVCLLNKFNVVSDHILVVTTSFEHQECPLTLSDFEALAFCLREFDCLGFYNGGRISGASQSHKHLQVVPLPFSSLSPTLPIQPAIDKTSWNGELGQSANIPFSHFLARLLQAITAHPPEQAAPIMYALYQTLMEQSPIHIHPAEQGEKTSPYNLLITRGWMMLVPRTREFYGEISLNALAFAGALLVRNMEQQKELVQKGCIAALKFVTE